MVNLESVWDRTSEFVGDHLAKVIPIALLFVFVPMGLMGNVMPLIGTQANATNVALGVAAVLLAIVTIWGHLALTALALAPADWKAAVGVGAGRLPAAVLVSLIEMAAVVLSVLPVFVVFAMSGVVPGQLQSGALPTMAFGPAIFILLYGLFLLVAVPVLVARLLLVDAALVAERRGASALFRSLRLTRGMTLKLVGVLLLYIVVSQVAALATKTVVGAILGLLTAGDGTVNLATMATATLVAVVQTGFAVLATIFAARLFIAVRDAREAIIELV